MHIGNRIKKLREEQKKTLLDIAKAIGVTEATVQRYESGNIKNLKMDTIAKLSGYFNVNPAYLMGWTETKENLRVTQNYPYLPVSISAGLPLEVEPIALKNVENISIPDSVMGKYAGNRSIFFMRINGESMNKRIPHHSLIAVKQVELCELKDGDIVVYSDSEAYAVKHFYNDTANERLIFRPDSKDIRFTDYIIPYSESNRVKIHGKVVVYIVEID